MAKTTFDIKTEATRGLYAGAGVTDLAVEAVRDYVAEAQKRLETYQKDVSARLADVQKNLTDPKARRKAVEARMNELQDYPTKVQSAVDETYDDLVARGESLVRRIRRQETTKDAVRSARTTRAKAKTTTTQATKTAKSAGTAARKTSAAAKRASKAPADKASTATSSAKATTTAAKKTATKSAQATAKAAEKVGD